MFFKTAVYVYVNDITQKIRHQRLEACYTNKKVM